MLNPFFLHGSKSEQGLFQDLINESLRMYGIDVYYLPREYLTEKTIIKEVIQSEFTNAYPIEAYVSTYEGYGNQGTLLSKFGIQEIDDLELVISKERYENYISPLIKDIPNIKLESRPKEGDLIYFPLGDRLFEIKYVEHEQPFYQLQKNYVYNLKCELFRYRDEVIDTSIDFIDDTIEEIGYIQTLQMVGFGSTATASASIVYGGVYKVEVTNRGGGYTEAPNVVFSSAPPIGGSTATGIASMIGNIKDFCLPGEENLLRVQAVQITNSGFGYQNPPKVIFLGGGGAGAEATAFIGDGIIGIVTITDGGGGYINSPSVTFVGIASTTPQATAIVSAAGTITGIVLSNAGFGYTEVPTIIIDGPPSLGGIGTYIYNEVVVGSSSSATARVRSWNSETNILEIGNIAGEFINGEALVGEESSATYTLRILSTDNLADPNDPDNKEGRYQDNDEIQTEGEEIIDSSEPNPFGIY